MNLPNCVDIKMIIKNILTSIFHAITNNVVIYIFISIGIFVLAITVYGIIKYFINKNSNLHDEVSLKKLMYLLFSLFMSYVIFLMLITHLGILYDVF